MVASPLEIFESSAFFVYFAAFASLMLGGVIAVPLLLASPVVGWARAAKLAVRTCGFIALLHAVALPANAVFVATARGRLYYAADPIADFLPYMPFSSWTTDPACGGHLLHGHGEPTFVAAWSALAIPVWTITGYLFRRMIKSRKTPPNSPLQPAATAPPMHPAR